MLKFIKDLIRGAKNIQEDVEEFTGTRSVSQEALDLIKKFEGYRAKAYQDVVGIWTIGYGNTYYEDGTRVSEGDTITKSDAEELLKYWVQDFADEVNQSVKAHLNDCQFGALVSFTYNVGVSGFKRSNLLKRVNGNPEDPTIEYEFNKWVKAGGKTVNGLVKRRKEECKFYFSKNCN